MHRKPLSLYVHIPFCIRKCDYCDFLSFPCSEGERQAYVELLLSEISEKAPCFSGYEVISVFFGGGTPSLLSGEEIARMMAAIRENFALCSDAEITLEANPGTVNKEKLSAYHAAGINRLSIGLQSAVDSELASLGRIHNYADFCRTFQDAREAGFDNINIDIMSAIPNQTEESFAKTLDAVLSWEPEHISAYSLILEEGTKLYDRQDELVLPDEETDRALYAMTGEVLSAHGYHRYEISNYAKPHRECAHNIVYWRRGNYLGLGLGASSMVENVRFKNSEHMDSYQQSIQVNNRPADENCKIPAGVDWMTLAHTWGAEEITPLSRTEQIEEYMFLGLRMTEGISRSDFTRQFGQSIADVYGDLPKRLEAQGVLAQDGDRMFLTEYGMDVSNVVFAAFLTE